MSEIDRQLRLLARDDRRLLALQTIYGIGPVLACHLLAEIGDARRFHRARQLVRLSGLDPVVLESGDSKRRGRLSKQGSPQLRWALMQAAQQTARRPASPDWQLYRSVSERVGAQTRRAHHRAQDRQARLPRPPRPRTSSLTHTPT